ncbi:MAG TPA: patatin-like phospholipase family protein [Trebonia sp.]
MCCSGGGIRSAAYCLGGLQALRERGFWRHERGHDDRDLVVGVSGGSYIAAAIALADHLAGDNRQAFAPGSAEEQRLRNNTHYLAPDGRTITAGLFSLLSGAFVISLILIAPVFVLAHALGWLLGYIHVLRWPQGQEVPLVSVTSWWWWLWPAAAAAVCAAVFVIWHRRGERGERTMLTQLLGWATTALVVLTVATMVVPFAVRWLTEVSTWNGPGASGSALTLSLFALVSTLAGLARSGFGQVQRWGKQLKDMPQGATSLLGKVGAWAQRTLLPWVAVALVVTVTVILGLIWVSDGSRYGATLAMAISVALAAVVGLAGRLVDVNRLSMHDFYRWRLAAGYGQGSATRLSELGQGGKARLVIATTANINAPGETAGQGAACLTFTPDKVTLWGGPQSPSAAATSDMELMADPARMTVFGIVALSGAALSPLMGRATRAAFRLPLTVANVRLGQWLPSPRVVAGARTSLGDPAETALKPPGNPWWLPFWYCAPHPRWAKAQRDHETDREAKGKEHEASLWASLLYLRSEAARLDAEIAAAGAEDPAKRRELRRRRLQARLLYRWLQPSLGLLWAETLGHCSYRQTWMYVTDGGHYDNLGLVAALYDDAERNDRILALDASGDPTDHWSTIGGAIALARVDAGFTVDLDPSEMRPAAGQDSKEPALSAGEVRQPWVRGTFDGPGVPHGQLWVAKLGWWHDASWDIRAYAAAHPRYPCDSTAQQLYDADEFEAYRSLGYQAVEAAIEHGDLRLEPRGSGSPAARYLRMAGH